jgi:hypothetical protein
MFRPPRSDTNYTSLRKTLFTLRVSSLLLSVSEDGSGVLPVIKGSQLRVSDVICHFLKVHLFHYRDVT